MAGGPATEAQMHHSWPVQYTNWTTPAAMVTLLEKFDAGKLLSPQNTRLLTKWMSESPRVSARLKGLLPTGTPVAHKPGTSDTSPEGITAATNDVGTPLKFFSKKLARLEKSSQLSVLFH